jgi:hypothetical protein
LARVAINQLPPTSSRESPSAMIGDNLEFPSARLDRLEGTCDTIAEIPASTVEFVIGSDPGSRFDLEKLFGSHSTVAPAGDFRLSDRFLEDKLMLHHYFVPATLSQGQCLPKE